MKKITGFVLLFALAVFGSPIDRLQAQDVTTVILVRHAEKIDDSRDPELSEEGKSRALLLSNMLEKATLSAVYTTDYIRTRETCRLTADSHELEMNVYDPRVFEQLDDMVATNRGKTIVVCGHSNSVPRSANHLLGEKTFEDFDEFDYGNIIIVTIPTTGVATYNLLRY